VNGQLTLEYNFITNPKIDYEIIVVHSNSGPNVTATNNWWGTTDEATIGSKMWDNKINPNLAHIIYTPYLLEGYFDCSDLNNCSGNGECYRPHQCKCNSGWTGAECTQCK
jgi:hypothetical protein